MEFTEYLKQRQLSPKSIETYQRYQSVFNTWLKSEEQEAKEITYPDLLSFVKHCKSKNLKLLISIKSSPPFTRKVYHLVIT